MSNELLESFREAYRNLELLPLLDQRELEKFRVDYGREVLEDLEQLVEDSPSGTGKIIFTGHRGCGKSTLLAEFSRQLHNDYFVVFFSISDLIEMSDVNHINILFAIAVRLMEEAQKQQVEIKQSTKDAFYGWFAKRTQIETEEFRAEASAGFKLFELIAGRLKADAAIRNEIKQEFMRKVSDLIARINEIAAVVQNASKKEIVVIIDDLDKLDLKVVREVFQEQIKALFQPNFQIIFTIPISAFREVSLAATIQVETNDQIVQMPVSKLFKQGERRQANAKPQPEAMATLQAILDKRIPQQLLKKETAEQIIIQSGGVLRELIRITNQCCRICLKLVRRQPEQRDIIIDQAVLAEAITKFSIDFDTRIGNADYEILETTYQNFQPNDPKEQRFLDLLHGLYILEYRNARLWYDIHPIVTQLLKDRISQKSST
ncbi:MAG: ATP-binding protein [Symploca sp. SIO2G7]|nr:ATP-binding protein [Symploca sp. SIO2G7]